MKWVLIIVPLIAAWGVVECSPKDLSVYVLLFMLALLCFIVGMGSILDIG